MSHHSNIHCAAFDINGCLDSIFGQLTNNKHTTQRLLLNIIRRAAAAAAVSIEHCGSHCWNNCPAEQQPKNKNVPTKLVYTHTPAKQVKGGREAAFQVIQ